MLGRIVFLNGKVFTGDAARTWVRAVAVEDGRIVAVGHEADVSEYVSGADVVDLEGRLLTPGFVDGHVHPQHGGAKLISCNLLDAADGDQALRIVADYAEANPDREWITGGGWSQDWFPGACPSAATLDQVVPDRPVFLGNRDGHGAWANTEALRRAGIDADTTDPTDGRIERLDDGTPQGTLHEGAMALVEASMPGPTHDHVEASLRAGRDHLLAHGITGWHDAWVDAPLHQGYLALADRAELVGSVVAALWWDRSGDLDQIEELRRRRNEARPGYRPAAVKLMLDGVVENFTASMLEPYLSVGGTGIDMIERDRLKEIVTRLDSEGFQCHFHAIGDAAIRNALDAVEAARVSNGWTGLRHGISHLQVVHPADVPRFHRLGVAAVYQPFWACEDGYQEELTQPFLGPERTSWQYPFSDLVDSGATLVGGSDWSVSTCDVMRQVEVAISRRPPHDRHVDPLQESQRIDPVTALSAFTAGSAWFNGEDAHRGSVAVGNLADLVVLDRDPFVDGPFGDARVEMTFVGGRVVYQRSVT